jgi:hypothetical protein
MSASCYFLQHCDNLKQKIPVNKQLVENNLNLVFNELNKQTIILLKFNNFLTECWTMVESQGWELNRTDTI